MNLQALDHVMLGILFILMPLIGIWDIRRLRAAVAAGHPRARTDAYLLTMIVQWGLVLAVLGLFGLTGRSWSDLGLRFEGGAGWWIGAGLGVAAVAALTLQTWSVMRSPQKRRETRDACAPLQDFIPHSPEENHAFTALSVTAGICEEVLYRGFVLAVLIPLFGTPAAVAISSVAFGLAHAYQGVTSIVKTGVVGLVMAGLFLLTGSLWIPMLLHIAIDVNSGYLGFRCLGEPETAPDAAACC